MSIRRPWLTVTFLALGLLIGGTVAAQEAEDVAAVDEESVAPESAPVDIERVSHANSSLILFDKDDRRYLLSDGFYENKAGSILVILNGRIDRVKGCGSEACDFTTHATRVVDRRILVYAEIGIPDGTYVHDSGSWFRVRDGELVEYQGAP